MRSFVYLVCECGGGAAAMMRRCCWHNAHFKWRGEKKKNSTFTHINIKKGLCKRDEYPYMYAPTLEGFLFVGAYVSFYPSSHT